VIVVGTQINNPVVEWEFSLAPECYEPGIPFQYPIGQNAVLVGVNTPYYVKPDQTDLSMVPPNYLYWLCAKVDYNDQIDETDDYDNVIRSDIPVQVIP